MAGYKNRILRVDLSERRFAEEPLSEDMIHDYVGGRGFGIKMAYDELAPGIDPLGEQNELIFLAGPLAGTNAQSVSRWKAFFKSPVTGGHFRSSGGGHWAAELKFAGFDGIVVSGIADRPVYLWVHDGQYHLRDATYLWGLNLDDTERLIREELHDPNVRIAAIGPAGENGVRFAGIFADRRAGARGGGGAVMGAKNLKAIAVRGREKVTPADPERFAAAVKEQVALFKGSPSFEAFSHRGTQHGEFAIVLGMYPTRNFREGVLADWEQIEGSEYDKLRVRNTACYCCAIHCGSIAKVNAGQYRGAWTEGPEYESIWAFTGPIACTDVGLTVACDRLCDKLGIDTISTAGVIGFAYELYERGLLTKEDTGGLELVYGTGDPVPELIRQIAYREGLGAILADGVREAARHIGQGSAQYAMHVKGIELPAYDPRGAKAHGLNLLTTSIGADHNSGFGNQEVFGTPYQVDRFGVAGKGALTKYNQDITAIWDLGVMCNFGAYFMHERIDVYGKMLAAATGVAAFADTGYLWLVGERVCNLERLFNVREGLTRKDDVFPDRFTKEAMAEGASAGQVFEEEVLLADYYQARGWDPRSGIPTAEKLDGLGLGFAKDLCK